MSRRMKRAGRHLQRGKRRKHGLGIRKGARRRRVHWVGTVLLLLVPTVNLAVLFEWASGHTRHPIRVNFARAMIPAVLAVYAVLAVGILVL